MKYKGIYNMKKIEDYWTISNVTGGRRRYATKQLALDSLGSKVPTRGDTKFHLEHHLVTVEDVEPNVEVAKEAYSYEEVKPIIEKIRSFLLEGNRWLDLVMYDDRIIYSKEVQDALGVDLSEVKDRNMYYYRKPDNITQIFADKLLSEDFLSKLVTRVKLISTSCDLSGCNGATLMFETHWHDMARKEYETKWLPLCEKCQKEKLAYPLTDFTVQVRPQDIVFHDSMIYGRHVNVRSWCNVTPQEFDKLVDRYIASIKKKTE